MGSPDFLVQNTFLLGSATANPFELSPLLREPAFRKATRNMALSHLVIKKIAEQLIQKVIPKVPDFFFEDREDFGLILTSETGELETTVEFLKTLAESQLARPLLFQNSLHNSTAGFLSMQWRLTGPVLTLSSSPFGVENALEMGLLLLSEKQCRHCFVISVDIWPSLKGYELDQNLLYDGAAGLLLSTDGPALDAKAPMLKQLQVSKAAFSKNSERTNKEKLWEPFPLSQNILYRLAEELKTNSTGKIEIEKPNGDRSEASWQQN